MNIIIWQSWNATIITFKEHCFFVSEHLMTLLTEAMLRKYTNNSRIFIQKKIEKVKLLDDVILIKSVVLILLRFFLSLFRCARFCYCQLQQPQRQRFDRKKE